MKPATEVQFGKALQILGPPSPRELDFLREHIEAPGRKRTARQLAASVRYQNWSAINLRYGILARRIGEAIGRRTRLGLLVEFIPPTHGANSEYILVMRKEFAAALKKHWL